MEKHTGIAHMNTKKLAALLTASSLGMAGCVGMDIAGYELGPNSSSFFNITGTAVTTLSATGCTFSPGTTDQVGQEMEFGDPDATGSAVAGTYEAPIKVKNNYAIPTVRPADRTYGNFGSNSSNDIEILAANVRYDYPDFALSFQRPRRTGEIWEGILSGASNAATGVVSAGQEKPILVKVVSKDLMRALFKDTEALTVIKAGGSFDVVAYIQLEGRTSQGGRVVSSEYAMRIKMSKGRIKNCLANQTKCSANDTAPSGAGPTRVAGRTCTVKRAAQCFPDQDFQECVDVSSVAQCDCVAIP